MDRVFCYARASGDSQLDGDGFPRRIATCREYAGRHDLKIAKIFREEAISGSEETMNRPAWAAMIDALLTNGVRTILPEKVGPAFPFLLLLDLTGGTFLRLQGGRSVLKELLLPATLDDAKEELAEM